MGSEKMSVLDLFDLSGKVSIVTGGGSGLGRIIATALGEAGSAVVICSRKVEKCEETAHDLKKLGVRAIAIQCDINSDEDVDRVVSQTLRECQNIDILVNNAGHRHSNRRLAESYRRKHYGHLSIHPKSRQGDD